MPNCELPVNFIGQRRVFTFAIAVYKLVRLRNPLGRPVAAV
jgi:hypothetical protein